MSTLTKEQDKAVTKYTDLMLKNGIKSKIKINKKFANQTIEILYKKYLDLPPPKQVIFVDSPEAAIKIVSKSTGIPKIDLVKEIIFLNWYSWWASYYYAGINFLNETKDVERYLIDSINEYEEITRNMHGVLPCENVCFVIEYPVEISIKDNDFEKFQLHKEGGLALEYSDGTGFAWLNGVEVPDYITLTQPNKLNAKKVMSETNVDIRREGLRRIPMKKFLKDVGATLIDKMKGRKKYLNYELFDADFKDGKKRRLLKMFDIASKTFTVERVEDNCDTVISALEFRDGETKYIYPKVRT